MHEHIARGAYWLGMACAVVAFVWRGLVTLGVPDRFTYDVDRAVGYGGFLNGAVLFLLVSAASSGYVWIQKNRG